jgi:hypothetical protein
MKFIYKGIYKSSIQLTISKCLKITKTIIYREIIYHIFR